MQTKKRREKNIYVDKIEFHNALIKYKKGQGGKKVGDYIGKCILDICNGLSKKSNFSGYTYIDEMRADGIENCIMAIDSYDVNNSSKNPFWYFSKIACYAFIRRIDKEKTQSYIKHKNVQSYYLQGAIEDIESSDLSDKVISDYENKQEEKKLKKARSM